VAWRVPHDRASFSVLADRLNRACELTNLTEDPSRMPPIEQIHPLAVHFPIVFFLTLACFDLVALARGVAIGGRGAAANVSVGLAVLAGLAAIAAYAFGDVALDIAKAAGAPAAPLELHEDLGTSTAALLVAWAVLRSSAWWRRTPLSGLRGTVVVVLEILGSLLVVTTAYFGGRLVYEFGVGVAHAAGG